MNLNDFSDDLLESWRSSSKQTPASQKLRDTVLTQTTQSIRNRRRLRRASIAAMLVACYLGGVATMSLWQSAHGTERLATDGTTVLTEKDSSIPPAAARKPITPEDDQIVDGSVPFTVARLTPYERLCRTGDQQLNKQDDIAAATRTYKKALQLASSDQRAIAPDHDTWLLMALKNSIN